MEVLKTLPDKMVQTIVTSPPYYGLRDYGTAKWEGGDPECDHIQVKRASLDSGLRNDGRTHKGLYDGEKATELIMSYRHVCPKCSAIRIDDQIGLEQTPEEYVAKLVSVFRECRRVLRDDGTLWLNLGDSYNGSGGAGGDYAEGGLKEGQPKYPGRSIYGLKPKDLIGIPWMVAFALRADGWYLRSDIIWHKPNPMPESVKDRPTKSHEYIFLLAKSQKYYYDAEAVKEPQSELTIKMYGHREDGKQQRINSKYTGNQANPDKRNVNPDNKRNRRSVWTVTTKPYKGAHFATFPPDLIEPCVLAGTSDKGRCPKCGAPFVRELEKISTGKRYSTGKSESKNQTGLATAFSGYDDGSSAPVYLTKGWQPTCDCGLEPVPCVVLDPFNGSGTTGAVALKHGRDYIGIELNPEYIELTYRRLAEVQPRLEEA